MPGWDCHGLPIEIKALENYREKHKEGEKLDAVGIRRAARALATKTVKNQMKGFREWGVMADWENAWRTMDKTFEIKQLEVFQGMVKKGLIFRRFKPVYWSPSSRTALAEAELEYKDDHESTAAYIKFPITNVPESLREQLPDVTNLSAVIWTTTPWTLPANRAIAISSDLEYSIVKVHQDQMIIAKSRLPHITKICFGDNPVDIIVDSILGKDLNGVEYTNPLRGKESVPQPIIFADFVSAESGSGLVHCAPGHGMEDYEACTRLGIPAVAPVNDEGRFTDAAFPNDPSVLEGKSVLGEGSQEVLRILSNTHQVLATHKYKHKYPYDWRTKLPVIVRATEQWFADVGSVKDEALRHLKAVRFVPEAGQARLESFVKGRSEWCISRQRAWGVPIPALYDENGNAVLTDASVAHILSVINERGIDAWWTDAPDDPAWIVPGLEGVYRRGKDTMDVWFDSGTSWTQTEQQADVYLEGTDQHRGWFQSSLLTHTCASGRDTPPFKTLITHGFTLDQDGRKMSKSIGNVIAPSQIMDGSLLPAPTSKRKGPDAPLGADALRLWVASSDYTHDVVIGQPVLKATQATLLKYRMILKMLLGSLHLSSRTAPLSKLDHIALAQLESTMSDVAASYANFEFHKGITSLNRWLTIDLSAFYLEAMKDRLYCADGGGVLEELFQGLLRMLAPVTPLLVVEAWSHRPEWMRDLPDPLHATLDEPLTARNPKPEPSIKDDIPTLLAAHAGVKTALEEARKSKHIGSSLEAAVVLQVSPSSHALFTRYADELASIFVVSGVDVISGPGEMDMAAQKWSYSSSFAIPDTEGEEGIAWVLPPHGDKCGRCWRYVAPEGEELCNRCEEVVGSLSV